MLGLRMITMNGFRTCTEWKSVCADCRLQRKIQTFEVTMWNDVTHTRWTTFSISSRLKQDALNTSPTMQESRTGWQLGGMWRSTFLRQPIMRILCNACSTHWHCTRNIPLFIIQFWVAAAVIVIYEIHYLIRWLLQIICINSISMHITRATDCEKTFSITFVEYNEINDINCSRVSECVWMCLWAKDALNFDSWKVDDVGWHQS